MDRPEFLKIIGLSALLPFLGCVEKKKLEPLGDYISISNGPNIFIHSGSGGLRCDSYYGGPIIKEVEFDFSVRIFSPIHNYFGDFFDAEIKFNNGLYTGKFLITYIEAKPQETKIRLLGCGKIKIESTKYG